MMNGFCVILSKYRLYQGIALYRSLVFNHKDFIVFILCIDEETYQLCSKLNLTNAILIRETELMDERLEVIRKERRLNEYCWTLKGFFIEHVLKRYSYIENAVYLDADICFFNDPAPIFQDQRDYCILLSEHDFLDKNSAVEDTCGKYNSGFIIFRNCKTSLDTLQWWKEKCVEWCNDGVADGRFGDQKYLEIFPRLFEGVYSISTPGVNIAPWNDSKYRFNYKGDKVYVDENQLICYHFCGLRLLNKYQFALVVGSQSVNPIIHHPYTIVVQQAIFDIENLSPEFDGYFVEEHFKSRAKSFRMGF